MKYFKTAFACILLCWAMPIALVALMNGSLERDYMNPDELIHGLNLGEYLALAISSSIIAFPLFLWAISRAEKSKAEKEHREKLQEELNKTFRKAVRKRKSRKITGKTHKTAFRESIRETGCINVFLSSYLLHNFVILQPTRLWSTRY